MDHKTARPGDKVNLIVKMDHPDGWNTFWTNPGTGMPTTLEWDLPEKFQTGESQWPIPIVKNSEFGTSHIYEGVIYIVTPLLIPKNVNEEKVEIKLRADWLECDTSGCIPRESNVSTTLTIGDSIVASPEIQTVVENIVSQQPRELNNWDVTLSISGDIFECRLTPLSGANPQPGEIYFFEDSTPPALEYEMPEVTRSGQDWILKMKKSKPESAISGGFLYASNGWTGSGKTKALWVSVPDAVPIHTPHISPQNPPFYEFGIQWIPWSTQTIRDLREEGRAIFVFYTADWDITSAVNKKRIFTSSGSNRLKTKIKKQNVAIVAADWTTMQKEITDDLARFDRRNIPVTLFYPSDSAKSPIILPDLLSTDILLESLEGQKPVRTHFPTMILVTLLILVATVSLFRFFTSPDISNTKD